MASFVKIVHIEAERYDGTDESIKAIMALNKNGFLSYKQESDKLLIETYDRVTTHDYRTIVNIGDWIVQDEYGGGFFACPAEVFQHSYVKTHSHCNDDWASIEESEGCVFASKKKPIILKI